MSGRFACPGEVGHLLQSADHDERGELPESLRCVDVDEPAVEFRRPKHRACSGVPGTNMGRQVSVSGHRFASVDDILNAIPAQIRGLKVVSVLYSGRGDWCRADRPKTYLLGFNAGGSPGIDSRTLYQKR